MATSQQIAAKGGKYKTRTVNGQVVNLTDAEVETCVDDEITHEEYMTSNAYKGKRLNAYPNLGEQLDMLYHDMTADKGDKTGEWYKAVVKVKSDHPKPE
jgi:hypothetical protein